MTHINETIEKKELYAQLIKVTSKFFKDRSEVDKINYSMEQLWLLQLNKRNRTCPVIYLGNDASKLFWVWEDSHWISHCLDYMEKKYLHMTILVSCLSKASFHFIFMISWRNKWQRSHGHLPKYLLNIYLMYKLM